MNKFARVILCVPICMFLAGCAPQDSLFPLFLKSEQVFDEDLLGEWKMQGGTLEIKPDEESGRAIFQKGPQDGTYEISLPDFGEDGETLLSTGRLVQLERYLFIDLATPDLEHKKNAILPYPAIESHIFGRLHLEKDKMRIDFLSDKWVSDQVKAGKLPLATVKTPNGAILTATTEDLRKFAIEHAEDNDVFSESYAFVHQK